MGKPENGRAGFKEWRHDLLSGLVVSFVAVAFGLAIASASGAPPIAGLIATIVSGFVFAMVAGKKSGPFVTVSGPAAGLVPASLAIVLALGHGSLTRGYPLLLVAVVVSGFVQVVCASLKLARIAAIFPNVVVEGMLAGIGLLVISKEIPLFLGCEFHAHGFWSTLQETPHHVHDANTTILVIAFVTLGVILALDMIKAKWTKIVPPQVIGTVVGVLLSLALHVDRRFLVSLPIDVFGSMTLPNWRGIWQDHSLWLPFLSAVVTLSLVGSIESVATVAAIDRIDPYRRKTDPNRALLGVGIANMLSGMVGGIAIIPGGVKSTANVQAGGRTQWSNFWNASFLCLFLVAGHRVITLIPQAVLGAVVAFTGYKLAKPAVWKHIAKIGSEQLVVFAVTVGCTITWGLLAGIFGGLAMKLLVTLHYLSKAHARQERTESSASKLALLTSSPVKRAAFVGDEYHIVLAGPVVCFNAVSLRSVLERREKGTRTIRFDLSGVTMMDHTSVTSLMDFHTTESFQGMRIFGLDAMERFERLSSHPEAARLCSVPPPPPNPTPALEA